MSHFFSYGTLYGYPECCIKSFCLDIKTRQVFKREPRKLQGTGYIPCKKCNEEFTSEQLVANINSKRLFEEPFVVKTNI